MLHCIKLTHHTPAKNMIFVTLRQRGYPTAFAILAMLFLSCVHLASWDASFKTLHPDTTVLKKLLNQDKHEHLVGVDRPQLLVLCRQGKGKTREEGFRL